eukprot:336648-Pleurochrysis_carterae.AAC.1
MSTISRGWTTRRSRAAHSVTSDHAGSTDLTNVFIIRFAGLTQLGTGVFTCALHCSCTWHARARATARAPVRARARA